jgi:hypothetical protein
VRADEPGVKLTRGRIFIATPEPKDLERNGTLLMGWYTGRARLKFAERLEAVFPPFGRMDVPRPELAVRSLSRRWGSVSASGRITLNRDLIRAPTSCIDYVITHELCHLIHADHSPKFYSLLDRLMPDWEKLKNRLERMMV